MRAYYPQSPYSTISPPPCPAPWCRHRLLLELQRSLIAFDPPAFVLDPQTRPGAPPSPPSVRLGSWHFIARPTIPRTPPAPPSPAAAAPLTRALYPPLDYGPFNCSIHHRHSWSRYYRGCWHQTCPPVGRPGFCPGPAHASLLPPLLRVGNFRACCRPWTWEPSLRLPLRYKTLISRHPSSPWQSLTLPTS